MTWSQWPVFWKDYVLRRKVTRSQGLLEHESRFRADVLTPSFRFYICEHVISTRGHVHICIYLINTKENSHYRLRISIILCSKTIISFRLSKNYKQFLLHHRRPPMWLELRSVVYPSPMITRVLVLYYVKRRWFDSHAGNFPQYFQLCYMVLKHDLLH